MLNELVFGASVNKLKQYAYPLKEQYDKSGWFKRLGIKQRLIEVLDEIDYQEGRLQFANRPYSFPSARLKVCKGNPVNCSCGCWEKTRRNHFKL